MKGTTIDPGLIKILACPESHQPLRLLESAELDNLNRRILEGAVKTVSGDSCSSLWEAGLIREDRTRAYQIQDGLPILLIEASIPL